MPRSDDEPVCPGFQPNVFDPSRCHDCLRQRRLHVGAEEAPRQKLLSAPVPSQAEEREAGSKDSDALSVVSSCCDVVGAGRPGDGPGSLCILSPDCELFIWGDDVSTDSCRDSVSTEDDYPPLRPRSSQPGMTRLDPAPHRPSPRAWMDETRSRRSGLRDDGQKRDSGYFSLGRAAGARSLRSHSPPAPFRHFERGHPIFSHRNVEPKDTVPFRNPNLGVASERQVPENLTEDLPVEILPPDPYEVAVEVEAQVGPRSPSPTPFKIAESLASTTRKGFGSSAARGTWSSYQQSGRFDSSRQSSALQSRASSPSRGNLPFRRSESTASLSRPHFEGGGWSKGAEPGSRGSVQSARRVESGTLPRNFKSLASSVTSQSNTVSDFRSALRRPEGTGSLSSRGDGRSSPPSRRDYTPTGQMSPRITSSSSRARDPAGRTSSPSKRGFDSPSPPRRTSQTPLRKSESALSLNGHGHYGRCGSPIREGYDIESQAQLRSSVGWNGQTHEDYEPRSPSTRGHEAPSRSILRKTEPSADSRSSSPGRRGHEAAARYQPKKSNSSSLLNVRSRESRNSSPPRRSYEAPSRSLPRSAEVNRGGHGLLPPRRSCEAPQAEPSRTLGRHASSPPRTMDPPGYSILRHATNSVHVSQRGNAYDESPPRSWRESPPSARGSASASNGSRAASVRLETQTSPSRSRSGPGRTEDRCPSPNDKRPSRRARSPPASPRRHTSSQSSMDSSESGRASVGSTGRNREEYATMADLPKVKMIHQMESQPRQELFKPASHSLSKHPSRERLDAADPEWHHGGLLAPAHGSTSQQPDLLNFKKGWMSKLDDSGEWKKHWFVLTDAGLKYYRDSTAEEKDDVDGEIDLKSCVRVSEFDVEKNYGFQIQTREAVFTLSAMTAGIRRNWIEVLKKCVRPSSSPDLTQLPDGSSDKENSHGHFVSSSRRHGDVPASSAQHRLDYVELCPVALSSSAQREAGEGQGREQEGGASGQWEAVLLRRGSGVGSTQRLRVDEQIERKWAEFERLPLKDVSSLAHVGPRSPGQPASEALQREVASLRQQLEQLQQTGGRSGGGVGCGPEAPCGRSLAAMERAHGHALDELRRQHERQVTELEAEKARLLLEEARDTARVMEALKKKHKEELEREVEKVKRLSSGVLDSQTLHIHQQAEAQSLQRELAGLSERYSQKCLELSRVEQNGAEREREIGRMERELEQLRKDNQELKARVKEEVGRLRSAVADSGDDQGRTLCELEVLLRVKENEVAYLYKEIGCLRNEVQFLSTEKRSACERHAELRDELQALKGRSEREIQSLKEHLRLAMAALQEGQKLGNSLDH